MLGVLYGAWESLLANKTANYISAISLLVSITALIFANYIKVENAVELRNTNKKRLLNDYCSRFSSDPTIQKVVRWLFAITELDSDDIKVYPKKRKDYNGNPIESPTSFEKERFLVFLTELNIQTKNKQLEIEDVRTIFSLYAQLFNKVQKNDNAFIFSLRKDCDYSELLPDFK